MKPQRVSASLLDERARAFRRHVPRALGGEVRGVHRARVASRRLREALPVVTAGLVGPKARKTRREIRRVTRALGAVRELDVALQLVDERLFAELSRPAVAQVRARLASERAVRWADMLDRLGMIDLDRLYARLRTVVEALTSGRESLTWRAGLARRIRQRAAGLASAVEDAGALYLPDRLHAVRIATKKLRYAMELADESGAASAKVPLRLLKRVQDTLGRLHDFEVLLGHAKRVRADATVSERPADDEFEPVLQAIEDEARRLHGRYVAARSRLRAIAEQAAREIAQRVAESPVARPRPLRMGLSTSGRLRSARGRHS